MKYFASASIDRETIPDSLVRADVISFFQDLGEREVNLIADTDTTLIDESLDFIYRAPLSITVAGLQSYADSTCRLELEDGTVLPPRLPVLTQGERYTVTINVNEVYGNQICPLDTGRVVVFDEIADRENFPDTLTVSGGMATYEIFASTPSLVRGRTEGTNDRSFQKALTVISLVEGRAPKLTTQWVLVTGHVAPAGSEFVTVSTEPVPMYILRDPPGDGSSAYLEHSTQICTEFDWTKTSIKTELGVGLKIEGGASSKFWYGVGGGKIEKFLGHLFVDSKLTGGVSTVNEKSLSVCLTTTDNFATSYEEDFIGGEGDVFVGAGLSFLFSEVGVISISDDCVVEQSTSVGFEPDGISTTFVFTERHITDTLIPELESKVAYYESLGKGYESDARWFERKAEHWTGHVAHNDSLKRQAKTRENISFSAGADLEYSFTEDSTRTHTRETIVFFDLDTQTGVFAGIDGIFTVAPYLIVKLSGEALVPALSFDSTLVDEWSVGYTLSDDDTGDNFTVDIKTDREYLSPIFDVRGGRSSCPYEPWLALNPESGEVEPSMVRRDNPALFIDPKAQFSVPPDDAATFKVTIVNLSDERRDYLMKPISSSNPGGAIMRLNGVPITDEPVFLIDAVGDGINSHEATLTVERGPSRFNYERLALIVQPVCGGDAFEERTDLFTIDTLYFDVSFEGCSDIAMRGTEVEPGWMYNRADSLTGIDVVLNGYELVINPKTPNLLDAVGIQYRYMGIDRTAPGPWTDIYEIPPGVDEDIPNDGSPDTIMVWQPDSLANGAYDPLADGIYELRAYTVCSTGDRAYSNVSEGTIDRNAPLVFGLPQPADGEFSLGEYISITFNEPLDCALVGDAEITLKYLDGPLMGQMISVTPVCNGESIVLVPQAPVADLDGRRLEASVGGVVDRVGNTATSTTTWQFDYRQSLFTWSQKRITSSVVLVTPGSIPAEIVNGTDIPVDYEITNMPGFVTLAPASASGRLAPGGSRSVAFDIDPLITGGIHEGQVTVMAVDTAGTDTVAVATLDLVLDVSCAPPTWAVDPTHFEYSMSMVCDVTTDDGTLTDSNDRLAAFVGEQLRGLANPREVAGDTLLFLTVFSNRVGGELVRFEVWDDDQCRRYRSTAERAPFNADDVLGTTLAPTVLTALDTPPGTVASFPLTAGWNWFSTNMVSGDMSVGSVLASLAPTAGDIMKSKTAFAVFDPDSLIGWIGSLTTLDNTSGYMVRLTDAGTVLQEGTPADPGATLVPVDNGWNWIGYTPSGVNGVGIALADLAAVLTGDEIVKGQTAFAEWNAGWFGSLETMEPGKGYRLFLQDGGLPSNFTYPSGAAAVVVARGAAPQTTPPLPTEPAWQFDPARFEYNMTVIAAMPERDVDWQSEENVVGAFVGDECRGIVPLMRVPGIERYLAFLTVHSDVSDGETVSFRAFDGDTQNEYTIAETLAFSADASRGAIREPLVLTPTSAADNRLPTVFRLAQNHPNPFNPVTTIRFEVPAASRVLIRIYNVAGQQVQTLVERDYPAGVHTVLWDGKTATGGDAASGVYFYQMQAGAFTDVKKMVLLR